jgi:dihydroflavonol-4-reductase
VSHFSGEEQVRSTDKILITGGTGFVGSAVAIALSRSGYDVRALVRPSSSRANLAGLDVEIVDGDIRDPIAVSRAMMGVRFAFHVAADYRLWARYPEEIVQTNVEGTRTVMRAALSAGVERIVYTSSVAALALGNNGEAADESTALLERDAIGSYKRSKVIAQALVIRMIAEEGLPAVIVNPSTPIGPRDIRPTPTGRLVVEAASGRVPAFVDTGLNLVHVDDVAAGHVAALERGAIGERYILGGENVLLHDMLSAIGEITGKRAPKVRIPRAAVYPIAIAAEALAKVMSKEPFVTLDGLRMSKHRMFFTAAKAERELGFRARPYREALRDAVAWFAEHGYLRT